MPFFLRILFFVLCSPVICHAYQPVEINEHLSQTDLSGFAEFYEDPKSEFKHPSELPINAVWRPVTKQTMHLGASSSAYWMRFKVHNTSEQSQNLYLSHELAFLDLFEVFWVENGDWKYEHVSGKNPFYLRDVIIARPTNRLALPPGQTFTVFIKLSNNHIEHSSLKVDLWTERNFVNYQTSSLFSTALFVGISLAICGLWGIFFVILRQSRFLAYSIFMGLVGGYYLAYSGVGFQFLYPEVPEIHNRLYLIMLIGAASFSFLFARLHLEPGRKGFHKIEATLKWLFLIGLALTIQAMFRFSDTVAVFSAMSYSGLLLFNSVVGILIWRRYREDFAFWFMLGWCLVGISMFILMLFYALGIGAELFTNDAAHFLGKAIVLIDGVTLSISLARWVQFQQEQKRTAEYAAMTDPLTGLFNRRALDQKITQIMQSSVAGERFCFAVLDIDFFKAINDEHGHKAGDLVLINVAKIISQSIRQKDMACRIGGEEFVVVFTDCNAEIGAQISERIRSHFENAPTEIDNKQIIHTISIGLVSADPHSFQHYDEVFKKADQALYQAKNQGRNRVVATTCGQG